MQTSPAHYIKERSSTSPQDIVNYNYHKIHG